jgi:hypothetical protein
MRAAVRSAFWAILAAGCAVLVCGFFTRELSATVPVGCAAFLVFAVWRPADALLVPAALAPIVSAIHALLGLPYGSTALLELLVLIALAAAAMRAAARSAPVLSTRFDAGVLCFVAIAAASCVAQIPAMLGGARSASAAVSLWTVASGDYFLYQPEYVAVEQTTMLIAGAALAALIARTFGDAAEAARLANMLVVGGTAAATLNVYRLLEVSLRRPSFVEAISTTLQAVRFNTQFSDLNAAGSYFAMIAVLAACRAAVGSLSGWLHIIALPLLFAALWVSGSRVALGAALLCTALVQVWRQFRHRAPARIHPRVLAAGAAALLTVLLAIIVFLLSSTRHGSFGFSLSTRIELLKVGGRMLNDHPVFGIGTSQFYARFPRYTSPELQLAFEQANGHPVPRENAHNQFLQIAAELGPFGLLAFLYVLFSAVRLNPSPPWRLPAVAGLLAFLVTSLAGHPLLTSLVAYPFWMVTGLAAAGAPPPQKAERRVQAALLAALIAFLIITMPLRWARGRADGALTIGMSGWRGDGTPRRWRNYSGCWLEEAGGARRIEHDHADRSDRECEQDGGQRVPGRARRDRRIWHDRLIEDLQPRAAQRALQPGVLVLVGSVQVGLTSDLAVTGQGFQRGFSRV